MKNNETQLVNACLELLRLRGIFAWRNNTGAVKTDKRFIRYGKPGSSDIIGVLPAKGRMIVVECKMPGNKPTGLQAAFLSTVSQCGGLAVCVRSVEELIDIIDDEEANAEGQQVGADLDFISTDDPERRRAWVCYGIQHDGDGPCSRRVDVTPQRPMSPQEAAASAAEDLVDVLDGDLIKHGHEVWVAVEYSPGKALRYLARAHVHLEWSAEEIE